MTDEEIRSRYPIQLNQGMKLGIAWIRLSPEGRVLLVQNGVEHDTGVWVHEDTHLSLDATGIVLRAMARELVRLRST